jgi:hypothetical protein
MKHLGEEVVTVTNKKIVAVECDACHAVYANNRDIKNVFELQEFFHMEFTGGYGSVFGDGSTVQCDLCQKCVKVLIGPYCRRVQDEDAMAVTPEAPGHS